MQGLVGISRVSVRVERPERPAGRARGRLSIDHKFPGHGRRNFAASSRQPGWGGASLASRVALLLRASVVRLGMADTGGPQAPPMTHRRRGLDFTAVQPARLYSRSTRLSGRSMRAARLAPPQPGVEARAHGQWVSLAKPRPPAIRAQRRAAPCSRPQGFASPAARCV